MKKFIVLIVLMVAVLTTAYCPNYTETIISKYTKERRVYERNLYLKYLKTCDFKTEDRSMVVGLLENILDYALLQYSSQYNIGHDELVKCITILFLSEGSNYQGKPSMSLLWRNYNNPFGLTGGNIHMESWEEVEGKRIIMVRNFKSYKNIYEAIDSLFTEYLTRKSFNKLKEVNNYKDFFTILQKGGYMTYSGWANWACIEYKKYY